MKISESHKVPLLEKAIRLQEYGVGIFKTTPTKSGIKKAIKKDLVYVNGKIATTALFIKGGESIQLYKTEESATFKQFNFPLDILFEDDYLAIVYKPSGILVTESPWLIQTFNKFCCKGISFNNRLCCLMVTSAWPYSQVWPEETSPPKCFDMDCMP